MGEQSALGKSKYALSHNCGCKKFLNFFCITNPQMLQMGVVRGGIE